MAHALKTTTSVDLTTATKTTVMDFTAAQSVQDIWVVNRNSLSSQRISLWLDYDGTNSGTPELFLSSYTIAASGILHVTGLWVFENGGRITAQAGTANQLTIHVSKADV